jgi:hypothetical protein
MTDSGKSGPGDAVGTAPSAPGELALGELAASRTVRLAKNKARKGFDMISDPRRAT